MKRTRDVKRRGVQAKAGKQKAVNADTFKIFEDTFMHLLLDNTLMIKKNLRDALQGRRVAVF